MTAVHLPVVGPMMQPKEEEENYWTQMLAEIGSKPGANIQGSVIILGDESCGKTSLLYQMTKKEYKLSSALEYSFLNIQSDYKDDSYAYQLGSSVAAAYGPSDYVNLPVYLLNGRTEFAPLLKFAFPQQLNKCCFVLMASLVPPENIIPSLEKWYKIIEENVKKTYDEKDIEAGKQQQIRFWQEYVEPLDTSMQIEHSSAELDPTLLPPEPNVLTTNIGVPIVVVLSKTDQYTDLNDDDLYRVQYHVRNFCINRGAALFYTSMKDDRNPQLLYRYLAHRVYNLPFTAPAYIVERDSVFIPSGWDSNQKIDIVKENLKDLSLPKPPADDLRAQASKETVVNEEDEQVFLARLQVSLNEPVNASPKREQPIATKNTLTPQAASTALPPEGSSPIMSFFGNLMKNPGSKPASSSTSTATVDPSAHFHKILNSSKPKKASNAGSDMSPRNALTANSSASALSDQDMDDAESVKSGGTSTTNTDLGADSQPNSSRE